MKQNNRLGSGGLIDRNRPLEFQFNGRSYSGYQGDTLASALLANGVNLVARSFKLHRPRGVFSAGSEEPSALVQLETGALSEPNCPATTVELYDGLVASSQHCWPSLTFDIGAFNNFLARLFPAGFYYKTFMWPKFLWMQYEKVIRHSAGLGRSPALPDPDRYDHQQHYCDILVIGGGASGLMAALAAAQSGAEVTLIDEQATWGGALTSETRPINGQPPCTWVDETVQTLAALDNVRLLKRTTVTGYYQHNYLIANQRIRHHLGHQAAAGVPRERLWKIRARKVVLATGALERPLVFADNDRPGVMLANALRSYLNRYGVLPGRNIAIITNNDSAYALASEAATAGATVTLLDTRPRVAQDKQQTAREMGITLKLNYTITGIRYRKQIRRIDIARMDDDGTATVGGQEQLACDLVAVSGGWNPMLNLYSQAGGKLHYEDRRNCFVARTDQDGRPDALLAGRCNAAFTLQARLQEGRDAGLQAARDCGYTPAELALPQAAPESGEADELRPLWILPCKHPVGRGSKKHFNDLHNDATIADVALAEREGYISVEHLKRYTTTGMGTDQGKTSNVNALTVMAGLRREPVNAVGTTTFRPPYTGLSFGSIVGQNCAELFLQKRTTPMHPWHEAQGAIYEDVGDWKRARYYPRDGENMAQAVTRECLAVRQHAGIMDATTLGKIDIQGKDAVRLINMVYTNAWSKLAIGRCRYGLMLNEHGMVMDDGVTTRLGEQHFHMTTTTGGAARVMSWLEELLQTEWPEWEVYCTSVTEQWAVMAINGPRARDLLSELTDADLASEAFPFMSMIEAEVAGVPARIFRISFSGELAFEINVPARYGQHVWEAVLKAGKDYQLTPYGTEAMHVLRAEKGFVIVGQDSDGSLTPYDLGMDWIVSKLKPDFIGKRSLTRSDTARAGRKQLVGLLTENPEFVLPEGAHVVSEVRPSPPMPMLGHVSSSYMSPILGRSIAMAIIKDGRNRIGDTLDIALMDGSFQKATVTEPVFFDKEGERSRG